MEESKIVIALKKFKRDYDWDNTLSPSSSSNSLQSAPSSDLDFTKIHINTAIEDFINADKRTGK